MNAERMIQLRKGEAVNLLITPRLFIYKGYEGATLEAAGDSIPAVMSIYADVLFFAALNWWELEGNDKEDFRYKRIDFHAWSAEHSEEFGKLVTIAIHLLSGKSLAEQVKIQQQQNVKKKSPFGWITTLWRRFLLGTAAKRKKKPAELQ